MIRGLFIILLSATSVWAAEPVDFSPPLTRAADGSTMVELHIAPCMIKQAEAQAIAYSVTSAKDCTRINRAAFEARKENFRRMRLKAGKYTFRVYNDSVPWAVDFAIWGEVDKSLPVTKGGKMTMGQGLEYRITLTPGQYLFRSPLGESPPYALLVEGPGGKATRRRRRR